MTTMSRFCAEGIRSRLACGSSASRPTTTWRRISMGRHHLAACRTFLLGKISTFSVVPSPTALGWRSLESAGFVQDAIKLTSTLNIRLGFRFESTDGWNEAHGRASNYGFVNGIIQTDPRIGRLRAYREPGEVPAAAARWAGVGPVRKGEDCHSRGLRNVQRAARQSGLPAGPECAIQRHTDVQERDCCADFTYRLGSLGLRAARFRPAVCSRMPTLPR